MVALTLFLFNKLSTLALSLIRKLKKKKKRRIKDRKWEGSCKAFLISRLHNDLS